MKSTLYLNQLRGILQNPESQFPPPQEIESLGAENVQSMEDFIRFNSELDAEYANLCSTIDELSEPRHFDEPEKLEFETLDEFKARKAKLLADYNKAFGNRSRQVEKLKANAYSEIAKMHQRQKDQHRELGTVAYIQPSDFEFVLKGCYSADSESFVNVIVESPGIMTSVFSLSIPRDIAKQLKPGRNFFVHGYAANSTMVPEPRLIALLFTSPLFDPVSTECGWHSWLRSVLDDSGGLTSRDDETYSIARDYLAMRSEQLKNPETCNPNLWITCRNLLAKCMFGFPAQGGRRAAKLPDRPLEVAAQLRREKHEHENRHRAISMPLFGSHASYTSALRLVDIGYDAVFEYAIGEQYSATDKNAFSAIYKLNGSTEWATESLLDEGRANRHRVARNTLGYSSASLLAFTETHNGQWDYGLSITSSDGFGLSPPEIWRFDGSSLRGIVSEWRKRETGSLFPSSKTYFPDRFIPRLECVLANSHRAIIQLVAAGCSHIACWVVLSENGSAKRLAELDSLRIEAVHPICSGQGAIALSKESVHLLELGEDVSVSKSVRFTSMAYEGADFVGSAVSERWQQCVVALALGKNKSKLRVFRISLQNGLLDCVCDISLDMPAGTEDESFYWASIGVKISFSQSSPDAFLAVERESSYEQKVKCADLFCLSADGETSQIQNPQFWDVSHIRTGWRMDFCRNSESIVVLENRSIRVVDAKCMFPTAAATISSLNSALSRWTTALEECEELAGRLGVGELFKTIDHRHRTSVEDASRSRRTWGVGVSYAQLQEEAQRLSDLVGWLSMAEWFQSLRCDLESDVRNQMESELGAIHAAASEGDVGRVYRLWSNQRLSVRMLREELESEFVANGLCQVCGAKLGLLKRMLSNRRCQLHADR